MTTEIFGYFVALGVFLFSLLVCLVTIMDEIEESLDPERMIE